MKQLMLLACALLVIVFTKAGDEKNKTNATLKSVKLYRSGAEMTHLASANLISGNNELTIDNISNAIDINSIQIKAPSSVTIAGIVFSNNYLQEPVKTPAIRMLEDSLKSVQTIIDQYNLSINNYTELLEVLRANKNIKGEQTGLSVAELQKLIDYYQAKSLELQTTIGQLMDKRKKQTELADKLKQQIAEEQKKNVNTSGRLILQLSAAMPVKAEFTISYVATNAHWTPYYDIRVDNINSPAKLLYKAKIVQTTGIDWKQVKLSLSTSVPSQKGNAPLLQSWFLGFIDPNAVYLNNNTLSNSFTGKAAGIQLRGASTLNDVVVVGYGSKDGSNYSNDDKIPAPVYVVNGQIMSAEEFKSVNPNSIKKIDVLKPNAASAIYGSAAAGGATVVQLKDGLEDYVSVTDNALNVNFDIDMLYDVPTDGKEQIATLQNSEIKTIYQHYAVPKLDGDVYLMAHAPEWEKLNLLPGEANIILEGTYVGKTFIDPLVTTDTLSLTLGNDKRVIVKREKLEDFSSVKFLGSNKLQKFTYEITVKNNKSEAIEMLLKDQFPLTTNKDIEVELLESSDADINKDLGILNWKLQLAPNETKKVRFAYSIKYPKDKVINLK